MGASFVLDNLVATTIDNYLSKFSDNVFKSNALFAVLKEKDNIKLDGGSGISIPIETKKSSTTGSFNGMNPLPIAKTDVGGRAFYNWKAYYANIVYAHTDVAMNAGKSKIADMITFQITNGEKSMMDDLGQHIYGDGTGNGGLNILGIAAIVSDTPTVGTLGTIDRSDANNAFWRNQKATPTAGWGSATNKYGRKDMDALFIDCRRGKEYPDLIVMGKSAFKAFKNEFELAEVLGMEAAEIKDYGSVDLVFNKAKVVYDEYAPDTNNALYPDNKAYLLNTDYLKLYINSEMNFVREPAMRLPDRAATLVRITVMLQLCANGPKFSGVLPGITVV